jgi:hypothetical protein
MALKQLADCASRGESELGAKGFNKGKTIRR